MKQRVIERAWGFTKQEYVDAFSRLHPRELMEKEFDKIFDGLESDLESSIGGDNMLFALLSMVSEDCRKRVLETTRWSADELAAQQAEALKSGG